MRRMQRKVTLGFEPVQREVAKPQFPDLRRGTRPRIFTIATRTNSMTKQTAVIVRRIEQAVKSGKLNLAEHYTLRDLAALLGMTRDALCDTVRREFGTTAAFCAAVGFTNMAQVQGN